MRLITPYVLEDLRKKMVFISGPRQCGKTTLAKSILSQHTGIYLNWDRISDRKKLLAGQWTDQDQIIALDEVHKFRNWKNLVKGFYDTEKEKHQFLVTGSARLEVYQRGGDSLLGRYHAWRLHPFSLFDYPKAFKPTEALNRLMSNGGFPEVFLDNDERMARRWRAERARRVIQEDIRDLASLKNISLLELMLDHLRDRVGSTLSLLGLAQEIGVSQVTAANWLRILERMYLVFVVRGYDKKITRAVHKPLKVYFYDNGEVRGDESVRFENFVACHLLQRNHFFEDYHGYRMDLCYVKDKNQREVDFLVVKNKKPFELVEAKLADEAPAKNLIAFAEILKPERALQVVLKAKKSWSKQQFHLVSPTDYFNQKLLARPTTD